MTSSEVGEHFVMAAHKKNSVASGSGAGYSSLERLPEYIFDEILSKFDEDNDDTLPTLCSLTCVSRTLNSSVKKHPFSLSSVNLSAFSLDVNTLNLIRTRFGTPKKIILNCYRLDDLSIKEFLGKDVEEVHLLKATSVTYNILFDIPKLCPKLRVLVVELSDYNEVTKCDHVYDVCIRFILKYSSCLEALEFRVRMGKRDRRGSMTAYDSYIMPQNCNVFKLDMRALFGIPTLRHTMTHISLVLYIITDNIVRTIVNSCPLLVELELIDIPTSKPFNDLSNQGVQSLVACRHLTNLSIRRSQQHLFTSFKRTTDIGMISLSEGCKGLESVRLDGFSRVSDVGFASILNSCLNLKKFEIHNAFLLTDLAFKDVRKVHRPLVEVKLVSCSSITSEGVCELATSCTSLVCLDLLDCKSVSDPCISNVSFLAFLTSLNLGGTNVADAGMSVLGKSNAPISCLSLRGCKRVTDEGITYLLEDKGKIGKTLSSLDLGHMPGITDYAITTVVDVCVGLVELCIRNCFRVTDETIKALAKRGSLQDGSKRLRGLDICNCLGVSGESFELLKPLFCGLQWVGIGGTCLIRVGDAGLAEIYRERPWLTICQDGCEVGCHDGWQYHKF